MPLIVNFLAAFFPWQSEKRPHVPRRRLQIRSASRHHRLRRCPCRSRRLRYRLFPTQTPTSLPASKAAAPPRSCSRRVDGNLVKIFCSSLGTSSRRGQVLMRIDPLKQMAAPYSRSRESQAQKKALYDYTQIECRTPA